MNKAIRLTQNYLLYSLPCVVVCMVWSSFRSERQILETNAALGFLWEALSWNLMAWFAVLILFLVALVAVPEARERSLKRLANLKERDEREEFITGKASRAAYISTLSLLILFLFLSVFSLNITREPEAANGKSKNLAIGLQFNLLEKPKHDISSGGEVLFESKDIPLSKTGIVLIVILWQLAVFNYVARLENVALN